MRFIRWDRQGAIVTRAFDYGKEHQLVFEFFARYCQLSREQCGWDPSVRPLPLLSCLPENQKLCQLARTAFEAIGEAVRENLYFDRRHDSRTNSNEDEGKLFERGKPTPSDLLRMSFTEPDGTKHHFLVTPPEYEHHCKSPFGRGTRRCLAYNMETGEVEFVKDSWRINTPESLPEAKIYKRLNENGVAHVLDLHLGGDVPGLVTEWQKEGYDGNHHGFERPKYLHEPLYCHRVFLKQIARKLRDFRTADNLFKGAGDAAQGA